MIHSGLPMKADTAYGAHAVCTLECARQATLSALYQGPEKGHTMSRETSEWLNSMILVGFTEKRGHAWWDNGSNADNHFIDAVPVERVNDLFGWEAQSRPVFVGREIIGGERDGDWEPVRDNTRQAIVHPETGHVFGIFGEGYQIHQYKEWLVRNVFTMLSGDVEIGSAGLLQSGGVGWVSVEMKENISTRQGVVFRPHLLAVTSMNGTMSTTYKRVVTNVVCDNTLAAGLAERSDTVKVKHSRNSGLQIAVVRETLDLITDIADDFSREVQRLTEIEVNSAQWEAFMEAHDPIEGKEGAAKTRTEGRRQVLDDLYRNDDRVAPWAGTGWGVLQAVNTYAHWEGVTKGGDDKRAERNMLGMVKGDFASTDRKTVETLERVLVSA